MDGFMMFKKALQKHFDEMQKEATHLFEVNVDKDELWNTYLDSFPAGTNEIFRERREHDSDWWSKGDDSFKVSTADDASIAISFQMSYRYDVSKLVDTYKRFKGMDGEDIVNNRVKSVLKSKVSEVTTTYTMMDIYSGNRSEINKKLTEYLNESFSANYGIEVLDASIVDVHPDEKLTEAIDARVTALQKKQQAQAEQETAKVEAETALINAQKDADVKIKQAQADADATKIAAEAEAEANRLKSETITDNLIKMKEAEARLKFGWVTVQGANNTVVSGQ